MSSINITTISTSTTPNVNLNNDSDLNTHIIELNNNIQLKFDKTQSSWDLFKNGKQVVGAWGDPHIKLGDKHYGDHVSNALFLTETGVAIYATTIMPTPGSKASYTDKLQILLPNNSLIIVENLSETHGGQLKINFYGAQSTEANNFKNSLVSLEQETSGSATDYFISNDSRIGHINKNAIRKLLNIPSGTELNNVNMTIFENSYATSKGGDPTNSEENARLLFRALSLFL